MKEIKNKPWYSLTFAICTGVVLFVILMKLSQVLSIIGTFLGFFSTVFFGAVIAYIIAPLAMLFRRTVFCWVKNKKTNVALGNALAFLSVIIFLTFLCVLVIPQIVDSVTTFAFNFNGYVDGLQNTLGSIGVSSSVIDLSSFIDSSNDLLNHVKYFASQNMGTIMSYTADFGKALGQLFIAFILSVYFLAERENLHEGGNEFLEAIFKEHYPKVHDVLHRSDEILHIYIVYNLIDAFIIGIVNAIFMLIAGLPYIGLVSVFVAVTNIIPTFGPAIGAAIGSFLLLLVEPKYALIFLIFTLVLQTLDGYVIKPKLFGDSLKVSGLWILIGIVAGGRMFGVVGILLAIPTVAILSMIYKAYLLPFLKQEHDL